MTDETKSKTWGARLWIAGGIKSIPVWSGRDAYLAGAADHEHATAAHGEPVHRLPRRGHSQRAVRRARAGLRHHRLVRPPHSPLLHRAALLALPSRQPR